MGKERGMNVLTQRELQALRSFKARIDAVEHVTRDFAAIENMSDNEVQQWARRLVFARWLVLTGRISR